MESIVKRSTGKTVLLGVSLLLINITLMCIFGYLTLDSEANTNSKIGALLLSFLIPYFIVSVTKNMGSTERVLKFGSGLIFYIVIAILSVPFSTIFFGGLIPCLAITLLFLYLGKTLLN
jgi:hypothetical protein